MAKAGFDLSDISAEKWETGMKKFDLDTVAKTDKGWFWTDSNSRNFVVTANNPVSGEYFSGRRQDEKNYASYVGVEGSSEFVQEFFNWFKENADYIKDEEFGNRGYI